MKIYSRSLRTAVVAAGLFGLCCLEAGAQVSIGSDLGTTMRDVLIGLEEQGYAVLDLELKRGRIEAEVVFDNREYEIDVDISTGRVIKIELDD